MIEFTYQSELINLHKINKELLQIHLQIIKKLHKKYYDITKCKYKEGTCDDFSQLIKKDIFIEAERKLVKKLINIISELKNLYLVMRNKNEPFLTIFNEYYINSSKQNIEFKYNNILLIQQKRKKFKKLNDWYNEIIKQDPSILPNLEYKWKLFKKSLEEIMLDCDSNEYEYNRFDVARVMAETFELSKEKTKILYELENKANNTIGKLIDQIVMIWLLAYTTNISSKEISYQINNLKNKKNQIIKWINKDEYNNILKKQDILKQHNKYTDDIKELCEGVSDTFIKEINIWYQKSQTFL